MVITEDFRYRLLGSLSEYELLQLRALTGRAYCIGMILQEEGFRDITDPEAVKKLLVECSKDASFEFIDYDVLAKCIASGASSNFAGYPR